MQLRTYQSDSVAAVRDAIAKGSRRIILQMETGGGKTCCAVAMLKLCFEKGRSGLFIARNRLLVKQAHDQLEDWGVPHGVLMRGWPRSAAPIQVASKDTFLSWFLRREVGPLPPADLVIPDEAHETPSRRWLQLLNKYPDAVWVGLTATPARGNGKGLGDVYASMVQAIPPSELIAQGWVVPTRVFAPYRPDLKKIPKGQNGDFELKHLARRMDKPTLVGDLVTHWKELADDRPTIVFTCSIDHCLHVQDSFAKAGVPFMHIDSRTTDDDQVEEVMGLFRDGKIRGIVNVGKLTQGVDLPMASCGILARPTRSYVLYRQMVGRLKRPWPGKTDCLLLDHAGAVYLHGMPDEDVEWTLDPGTVMTKDRIKSHKDGPAADPVCCSRCYCMYKGPECPNCGHKRPRVSKKLAVESGKLVPVTGPESYTHEQKVRYWHRCLGIAANKGRTFAAASAIFMQKFGEWPTAALPNYPSRSDWARPVGAVYPGYVRGATVP
jgi:DNA repair protein RadD